MAEQQPVGACGNFQAEAALGVGHGGVYKAGVSLLRNDGGVGNGYGIRVEYQSRQLGTLPVAVQAGYKQEDGCQ